jgi:Luciferase-like monooxygenase
VSRLLAAVEHTRAAAEANPPEAFPVLLVVVDEDGNTRVETRVLDPPKRSRPLRLRVHRRVERVALHREDDGNEMRPTVGVDRGQASDPRFGDTLPEYADVVHLGVIVPNYGEGATPQRLRRSAEVAEELGFDSVWATEHIIVGPEAADTYGTVFEPFVTLGWIAGFTKGIGFGTSIILVPLHHPIELAKQVATLQRVSGRAVYLGVGMGWHEDAEGLVLSLGEESAMREFARRYR